MRNNLVETCYNGYEWPKKFSGYIAKIDVKIFKKIIKLYNINSTVFVTFLSKEYLGVGKLWLTHFNKLKIKQLIVIAVDIETSVYLDSLKIPSCLVDLSAISKGKNNFKSQTGFTSKGLAITNLKYPIVKLILKLGYDALLIDIDAILLKPIPKKYFVDIDIAFQRVVYFPDPIAKVWSFTACSGFVFFRSNNTVISLLNDAIKIQKKIYDDQITLNVALFNCNVKWLKVQNISHNLELKERKKHFTINSSKVIYGIGVKKGIRVKALPPKIFWRNDIVPLEISKVILFHPNSEKTEVEKLKKLSVFNKKLLKK
jgi:hypothetical protein